MTIEKIVEQALQDGYLTPAMEAEVGRICDTASELSIEEYMALDRLMGALLTGKWCGSSQAVYQCDGGAGADGGDFPRGGN
jgi:hypothetical protein